MIWCIDLSVLRSPCPSLASYLWAPSLRVSAHYFPSFCPSLTHCSVSPIPIYQFTNNALVLHCSQTFDPTSLPFEYLVEHVRPLRRHLLGLYEFCSFLNMGLTSHPPFWMMFTKTVRYDGATLTVKPITFLWTYKSKGKYWRKGSAWK